MADIFLSYAREDLARARLVASALESRGCSVWWDRRIPHGQDFGAYIQQQLDDARCIVVLWSKASVVSQFVRDEASEGQNGRLVPALIEQVRVPLGFRQLHTANLSDWTGEQGHEEFERLLISINALTSRSPARGTAPSPEVLRVSHPDSRFPRRIYLSYRREDSAGHVLALMPALQRHFGPDRVVKSARLANTSEHGADYLKFIQRELQSCAVMLVVIGREWAASDDHGTTRRSLDDPNDSVRAEITTALAAEDVVVVPVLVEGAQMPAKEDLPTELQALVDRNALQLSDSRWESDVNRLMFAIARVCKEPEDNP